MPADLGQCPPPEILEGIAAGQNVATSVREHTALCPTCQSQIHQIRDDNALLAEYCPSGLSTEDRPFDSSAAIAIPGYDILRELHRGGQGIVFEAIQRSTRREVAIKVIRAGSRATLADRARFAREIETLSALDHPNLVAIHDAGIVGGNHFFVMDYIDGAPLDEALHAQPLTDILQTVAKICDAVHIAHLRGVMHRDLKPSNIRVDRMGQPHVLDFGLAKSLDESDLAMTATGQFVGSLPWASPEQVEGASTRVDVRTDVYSLGAILYQLLTGVVPFEVGSSLRDTVDSILHREPQRPAQAAAAHGLRVNDEVETIVLKCLAKERERRYQSAGELARDLRRCLAGEALDAKRDSAWYVLRKTAWRKRRVLLAIAVPMVLFPFALYALHRETLAARQAELERDLRRIATARNSAMVEIARRLQAPPGAAPDAIGSRLSRANIDALQNDLDTGSLSVADHGVALLLAEMLRDQGRVIDAEGLVRRALYMLRSEQGSRHAEVGRLRVLLADLLRRRGTRMREARQEAEQAIAELAAAFGPDSPALARGWIVLARVKLDCGEVDGARDAARRALNADRDSDSDLHALAQAALARVYAASDERSAARHHYTAALDAALRLMRDTDTNLLDIVDLGAALSASDVLSADEMCPVAELPAELAGRSSGAALHEAVSLLRGGATGTPRDDKVAAARLLIANVRAHRLGPQHPSLGASLASAAGARLQLAMSKPELDVAGCEETASLLERAIPLQVAAHGMDSPLVGKSYERLATCKLLLCHQRDAVQWFERDCELWTRQPPSLRDDYQILIRARWTAWYATRSGDYERGLAWTDRTLDVLDRTLGRDDGGAALVHACRALCFANTRRDEEARDDDARAGQLLRTQAIPEDQQIECARLLGLARLRLGMPIAAGEVLEPAWRAAQPVFDCERAAYRMEWALTMRQYYHAIGAPDRAEYFDRCLREEALGDYLALRDDVTP